MVISVINQKGGVAKTTSTFNLAHILSQKGYKVLQVDIDAQASLTIANGLEPDTLEYSMYSALMDEVPITDVIYPISETLDLAVANIELSAADLHLTNEMARETRLKQALDAVSDDYDFVLIDCPPNLGLLTINALTASDYTLIPVATDYLSLRGLNLLLGTIESVKARLNTDIEILGIIATRHDMRTLHDQETMHLLEEQFTGNILGTISESIRVKDSISATKPLITFDANHKTTHEYAEVADKIIEILNV